MTVQIEAHIPPVHLVVVRMPAKRTMGKQICIQGEGLQCSLFSRDERLYLPPGNYEAVAKDRRNEQIEAPLTTFKVPYVSEIDIPQEAGQ